MLPLEFDNTNFMVVPFMDNFVEDSCFGGKNILKEGGVGGKKISKEGQVFFLALGFSVRDDLLDCHPLMTIAPSVSGVRDDLFDCRPIMTIAPSDNNLELALPVELDKDNQLFCLANSSEISRWVTYRILGFCKFVGLPLNQYSLCIALLQRLEREMEVDGVLYEEESELAS